MIIIVPRLAVDQEMPFLAHILVAIRPRLVISDRLINMWNVFPANRGESLAFNIKHRTPPSRQEPPHSAPPVT